MLCLTACKSKLPAELTYDDVRLEKQGEQTIYYYKNQKYSGKIIERSNIASTRILTYYVTHGLADSLLGHYKNGVFERKFYFKNGLEDGRFEMRYINDKLYVEQHYKQGKPHGSFKRWNDSGKLLMHKSYINGIIDTIYLTDGRDIN